MTTIKCELYALQGATVAQLEKRFKKSFFHADGDLIDNSSIEDYSSYLIPILEEDHEKQESYEHQIEATSHDGITWTVNLELSY